MMDDKEDRLDALLRDAAQEYNPPPEVPRAEMWDRIQAARRQTGVTPNRRAPRWQRPKRWWRRLRCWRCAPLFVTS